MAAILSSPAPGLSPPFDSGAFASALPQDKPKDPFQAHPKVDQKRVDEAIRKGVAFLQKSGSPGAHRDIKNCDELILFTLVHAGVSESDPRFAPLFKNVLEAPLEKTYKVALQAMALEEIQRVKYQWRLQQCAQFLVDNQCRNGQWSYGEPSLYVSEIPVPTTRPGDDVATGPQVKGGVRIKEYDPALPPVQRQKPKVLKKVSVKKKKDGEPSGDNSNSQYAALGLRACHDAGVTLPKEVVEAAAKWWRDALHPDEEKAKKNPLASDGWCYGPKGHGHKGYGSMTAGALGSLAIYDFILDKDWKKDREVLIGLDWITRNFSVTANPGPYEHADGKVDSQHQYYYYLYALERAGVLYGTETFGVHEWYPAGAEEILKDQRGDGSWTNGEGGNAVWDTCFAILFLRRATRPLGEDVATRPAKQP
jgi:hypothetical protein